MDFEGLKVGVGGNLEDGFWISCVPKADIAVDRGGDDFTVDAALRVDIHHPTLMLA